MQHPDSRENQFTVTTPPDTTGLRRLPDESRSGLASPKLVHSRIQPCYDQRGCWSARGPREQPLHCNIISYRFLPPVKREEGHDKKTR